jgi:glycosyltransferase involved in cell wall biosynthesis
LKIIIGIPAFNEEKNIATVITKIGNKGHIIVCDDGSTDQTSTIAAKMGATIVSHQKNLGYGSAIRSLFLKACEMNADVLVTMDADGQHRIEDIDTVLTPILNNEADVVIGSRFLNEKSQHMPSYRKMGIRMITRLANTSMQNKVTDAQSGFRAYNKNALTKITPSDTGMGVSNEILLKADKENLRIGEVPIRVLYCGDTSTHHPVSHGVSVVVSTMKFISIEHPLKFYGIPGAFFLALGLFFTVWTLQIFSETRQIITNVSLIGIGTIIFGTILIMNAIMLYSIVNLIRETRR